MSISSKKIIENANKILAEDDHREKVNTFLEVFSQCEVYVRPVLLRSYKSNGEEIKPEEIGLDAKTIKDAFSEEGIYFEDGKLITRIFGAEDALGKSSCRWLRNKILHELMKRALTEVCNRFEALTADMNSFIEQINSQTKQSIYIVKGDQP